MERTAQDQVTFRYASISDVPRFLALFKQVIAGLDCYGQAARDGEVERYGVHYTISEMSRNERALSLAVSPEDDLLGFCVCQDQNGPMWLDWYGVSSSARGRGIAEALLRWVCAETSAAGATKLWCATRTENGPSIRLFRKLGFREMCLLQNHWYREDYLLWERRLATSRGAGIRHVDGDWASQLQHTVEGMDGDVHLGRPARPCASGGRHRSPA